MQQALGQIRLLAPQGEQLRDAQAMPIGQEDHGGVGVAVTTESLGGGDQSIDFIARKRAIPVLVRGFADRRWEP